MVWACQTCWPVVVSNAITLPRNVQQGYAGSADAPSSPEEMGTYSRVPTSNGDPVMRAAWCASGCTCQITEPSSTLTAYTFPFVSPKKAAVPRLPMEIAVFTVADALNIHHKHPVAESRAYTVPSSLPTNSFPA